MNLQDLRVAHQQFALARRKTTPALSSPLAHNEKASRANHALAPSPTRIAPRPIPEEHEFLQNYLFNEILVSATYLSEFALIDCAGIINQISM